MKLLFKQRFFSWLDSYDIYDEQGNTVFTVEGKLSWGHRLVIYDAAGQEVGMVKEEILTFLPRFEIYENGTCIGEIQKEFTFFRPRFSLDFNGWTIQGDFFEWDYAACDARGVEVMRASKEIWNWTDTYSIEVYAQENILYALMIVLAIDAAKCSSDS